MSSKARQLADAIVTSQVVKDILETPETFTVVNSIVDSDTSEEVLRLIDSSGRPRFITMFQSGQITSPFTGVARAYAPGNIRISKVNANVGTAPSSNLTFNLLKNGVSVGNYTIATNTLRLTPTDENITATDSDYLTLNIDSGAGATDLKVDLSYRFI